MDTRRCNRSYETPLQGGAAIVNCRNLFTSSPDQRVLSANQDVAPTRHIEAPAAKRRYRKPGRTAGSQLLTCAVAGQSGHLRTARSIVVEGQRIAEAAFAHRQANGATIPWRQASAAIVALCKWGPGA